MTVLTHVSLFSGIGGIDIAFERAGVPTIAACEIDKAARGVINDRSPDTHLFEDVKDVTGDGLRNLGCEPARTILTGGFPCQDLSVAGARRGMVEGSGTRSALFWEIDRILAEFRPAWVVLENVPGLLSSRGGRDMGAVLGSLGERGYGFAYRVLDAQHFGVPQRRRRVVIVGRFGDDGRAAAQVLLEPESVQGNPAEGITPRPLFARTTQNGNRASGVLGDQSHTLTGEGFDASEDGTGRGTPVVAFHMIQDPISGAVSPALGAKSSGMGIMTSKTAATLTAGVSGPGVNPPGRRQEDDVNLVAYVADQVSTLQAGGGDRGYRIDAEGAAGGHLVATYQKVIRSGSRDAEGKLPPEVWAEREVAATLSPLTLGRSRAWLSRCSHLRQCAGSHRLSVSVFKASLMGIRSHRMGKRSLIHRGTSNSGTRSRCRFLSGWRSALWR